MLEEPDITNAPPFAPPPPDRAGISTAAIQEFDRRWRVENVLTGFMGGDDDDEEVIRRSHVMKFSHGEPFTLALRRSRPAPGKGAAWALSIRCQWASECATDEINQPMNQFTIYSILHFIVRSDEGPVLAVRCSINLCVLPASPENGGRGHEGKLEDVMLGAAALPEEGVAKAVGWERFLHVQDVEGLIERYDNKAEEQEKRQEGDGTSDAVGGGGDGAITVEAFVEVKGWYESIEAVRCVPMTPPTMD